MDNACTSRFSVREGSGLAFAAGDASAAACVSEVRRFGATFRGGGLGAGTASGPGGKGCVRSCWYRRCNTGMSAAKVGTAGVEQETGKKSIVSPSKMESSSVSPAGMAAISEAQSLELSGWLAACGWPSPASPGG